MLQITFTPILLGVALAHALHHRGAFAVIHGVLKWRHSPTVLLAAVFLVCNVFPENLAGWPRLAIHFSLLALLASCVVQEDHALRAVLTWPPIARLGIISYGMYLYHMWVLHFASKIYEALPLKVFGGLFLLCFLGTVAISELSNRYYELPFLSLKDRFKGVQRSDKARKRMEAWQPGSCK